MRTSTIAAGVAVAVVIAAIAAGLFMLGPPSEQRARRLDERRVRSLQTLQAAIDDYWRTHRKLPDVVAELSKEPRAVADVKDPVTGREYPYRVRGATTYQLCADFERPGPSEPDVPFWTHPAGTRCFDFEARDRGR